MKYTFYRQNKKGNIFTDVILALAIIFTLVITIIVGRMMFTSLNSDIQADPDISAEAKAQLADRSGNYSSIFDFVLVFFIAMVWLAMLITSFFIDSHPIFFFLALIAMLIILIVSFAVVNSYEDFAADGAEIQAAVDEMPITHWIMTRLPMVIFFMILSVSVALYAKTQVRE